MAIRTQFAVLLTFCTLALPIAAQAEDRWVVDEFEIMMRSGKSIQQSIVRQLKSGTKLEVLEVDEESGYTRVQLSSGVDGWVLTRYLQRSPTARLLVPELETKLKKSSDKVAELSKELAELKKERQQLRSELQEQEKDGSSTRKQLERITELSADTIKVDEQNRQLNQRLVDSELQIEELTADNNRLSGRADREWFLVGSAVLFAGLLLGLIIPRLNFKKKSSWGDF